MTHRAAVRGSWKCSVTTTLVAQECGRCSETQASAGVERPQHVRHPNVLEQVRSMLDQLRRSERKVAEKVLANPADFVHQPLAAVARSAGVSEPTVVRFCRAVGADGYQDFRLRLAMSLGSGDGLPYVSEDIGPGDSIREVIQKSADHALSALKEVRDALDPAAVGAVVEALAVARRVQFYGSGASGVVALDAQHKFIRMDVPGIAYVDAHQRVMAAAATGPGDVVLAFSSTGRSRDIAHATALARSNGATSVGVTRAGSRLAEACSLVIDLPARENTELYTPMVSRLAQLLVVDVLVTGLMLRRGPALVDHLRKLKVSLAYFREE
ncbi:MAG: SIS domain-containing protein [Anaeromyxobacter sp.]